LTSTRRGVWSKKAPEPTSMSNPVDKTIPPTAAGDIEPDPDADAVTTPPVVEPLLAATST